METDSEKWGPKSSLVSFVEILRCFCRDVHTEFSTPLCGIPQIS